MLDTHPKIAKQFQERLMKKSNFERLAMGASMYDTAKEIVRISILNQNPNISQKEMKKEIFLRFYRQDFDEEMRNSIIKKILSE